MRNVFKHLKINASPPNALSIPQRPQGLPRSRWRPQPITPLAETWASGAHLAEEDELFGILLKGVEREERFIPKINSIAAIRTTLSTRIRRIQLLMKERNRLRLRRVAASQNLPLSRLVRRSTTTLRRIAGLRLKKRASSSPHSISKSVGRKTVQKRRTKKKSKVTSSLGVHRGRLVRKYAKKLVQKHDVATSSKVETPDDSIADLTPPKRRTEVISGMPSSVGAGSWKG
jgi:hypothetical protein